MRFAVLGKLRFGTRTPSWCSKSKQAVDLDDERPVLKLWKARCQRITLLVVDRKQLTVQRFDNFRQRENATYSDPVTISGSG